MRELAGNRLTDEVLRSLWLQRLPAQVQAILSNDDGDIPRLLTTADRITEVLDVRGDVNSVISLPRTEASDNLSELQRLTAQVSELTKQIAAFSSDSRNTRARSNSRKRRGRSSDRNSSDLCYYHDRFGAEARKCRKTSRPV